MVARNQEHLGDKQISPQLLPPKAQLQPSGPQNKKGIDLGDSKSVCGNLLEKPRDTDAQENQTVQVLVKKHELQRLPVTLQVFELSLVLYQF